MASSFSGGGPDFYNTTTGYGGGRSITIPNNTPNNATTTAMMNNNNNNISINNFSSLQQQQQHPITITNNYRSQLPGIFLDQASANYQISNGRTPPPPPPPTTGFIGKRTLAEFQNHHHHHHLLQQQQQQQYLNHQNPALANLLMRSVKPRMYQNVTSPISPLSPMDFSSTPPNLSPEFPSLLSQQQQRFGGGGGGLSPAPPLLQQLRSGSGRNLQVKNPTFSGVSYINNNVLQRGVQAQAQVQVQQASQDSEKMMNRLQELEKQLLADEDVENDAVSVITNNNSEWSETIQSLISGGGGGPSSTSSPNTNPVSPSPTSSSSSSSTTVSSSPASSLGCSKQTLVEAASAISEGKIDAANEILTRVMTAVTTSSQVSNPVMGSSNSEQRLMEYLLLALKSRVNQFENPPPVAELYGQEHTASTQLLYELSPCFKLGFMAANLAILEATLEQSNNSNSFHIVDFDIGQGGQYMNLLHALSARQNGKPPVVVKITAVADCENDERLAKVGELLSKFAEDAVGVNLRFNVVVLSQKLGDLSRDSLGCDPDEPLAVNFAFKLYKMPDESVSTDNPRDELLRRVKALSPRVVTLIEQEMNTNTAPFMARVNEVCNYYGALLESIDSTVPRENSDRVKVEEGLSRRLANSVACEGRERVERCEVFGKWRARMGMAGFELKKMNQNVAESMRARLVSGNRVNPGFTVKEENGGVCFGWMGKTLTVASAWR